LGNGSAVAQLSVDIINSYRPFGKSHISLLAQLHHGFLSPQVSSHQTRFAIDICVPKRDDTPIGKLHDMMFEKG
jgi:hypothetical protein